MGTSVPIPRIILAMAAILLVSAPLAFLLARRGGRFRALPGWVGFWVFFGTVLVALSRANPWVSFPLLAVTMFLGLRQYFFLTPVRPQDRWALVASYLTIPLGLWPAFLGRNEIFLEAVPLGLFLVVPVTLCLSERQTGLLDSLGRVLLGATVYVYGAGFLGLLSHQRQGTLELFAILALLAELTQRLAGRLRPGEGLPRRLAGLVASAALTAFAGWYAAPWAGVIPRHGAYLGLVVVLSVAIGARVATAVAKDLEVAASSTFVGRAAFLDRTMPALVAAPLYHLAARWFVP